ncbi:MAG: response regulator [Verrucomicrobiota bacterium]
MDDEETVRATVARMLQVLGFKVLLANNGEDGLQQFREHTQLIAAVLLDLTMPRLDGEATFREMRRVNPNVRAVLMSGFNEQDAISRFVGKGLAGFVQKPFRLSELRDTLRRVLG